MAGLGGQRHRAHRAESRGGVVLGDPDNQPRHDEAHRSTAEQVQTRHAGRTARALHQAERLTRALQLTPTIRQHRIHDDGDQDERDHAGRGKPLVERAHDIGRPRRQAHEEGADNRGENAHRADRQRQDHDRSEIARIGEIDRAEHHGGHDGHRIGLEQVGRHAGTVADIVAHIVGDGGRVARIVFRNSGFDLADHVTADIGALGEDAAAEAGEDRDQRGAEAERDQRVDHFPAGFRRTEFIAHHADQEAIIENDAQQGETNHKHAGNGAGLERQGEARCEALAGGFGGAHIRAHRDLHADKARRARQDRADQEADRHLPVAKGDGEHDEHRDPDIGDHAVLAREIRISPLLDGFCDLLHPGIAIGGPDDRSDLNIAVNDGHKARHQRDPIP